MNKEWKWYYFIVNPLFWIFGLANIMLWFNLIALILWIGVIFHSLVSHKEEWECKKK